MEPNEQDDMAGRNTLGQSGQALSRFESGNFSGREVIFEKAANQ